MRDNPAVVKSETSWTFGNFTVVLRDTCVHVSNGENPPVIVSQQALGNSSLSTILATELWSVRASMWSQWFGSIFMRIQPIRREEITFKVRFQQASSAFQTTATSPRAEVALSQKEMASLLRFLLKNNSQN